VERQDEWVRVERTQAFKDLVARKRGFIIPATLTLAYVYAFAQFAMTWILMHLYVSRANRWDNLIERARREAAGEAEGAS
jgi:uncharacterized membrane protein (DUF485 family)